MVFITYFEFIRPAIMVAEMKSEFEQPQSIAKFFPFLRSERSTLRFWNEEINCFNLELRGTKVLLWSTIDNAYVDLEGSTDAQIEKKLLDMVWQNQCTKITYLTYGFKKVSAKGRLNELNLFELNKSYTWD